MKRPKLILLDADGTLWRGGEALPHAREFILRARAAGCRCLLVSNNAGPGRGAYRAKCEQLGLPLGIEDIYSTNYLAGPYLRQHYPEARVLVLGSEALALSAAAHCDAVNALAWLREAGLDGRLEAAEQLSALLPARFDAVLCGIDLNVSYAKLALACHAINQGAAFIAANTDRSFPFEGGMTFPGNGSIVHLISEVCGVPALAIGKPELHFIELIEKECGVPRGEMLVIGDRPETDIELAARAGCPAYLVLSGVTDRTAAEACASRYPGLSIAAGLAEAAASLGLPAIP